MDRRRVDFTLKSLQVARTERNRLSQARQELSKSLQRQREQQTRLATLKESRSLLERAATTALNRARQDEAPVEPMHEHWKPIAWRWLLGWKASTHAGSATRQNTAAQRKPSGPGLPGGYVMVTVCRRVIRARVDGETVVWTSKAGRCTGCCGVGGTCSLCGQIARSRTRRGPRSRSGLAHSLWWPRRGDGSNGRTPATGRAPRPSGCERPPALRVKATSEERKPTIMVS